MSRIGKLPIAVPGTVKVEIKDTTVTIQGPKGSLSKTFAPVVEISMEDNNLRVSPRSSSKFSRAMYGTTRSILANMVEGVSKGYEKDLEIHGVGFRAAVKGRQIDMSLGYSHPILHDIPEGVTVTVTDNTKIKVAGIDKQVVGQVTAALRSYYPPEPYKGKGVRIVGERVRRKEGKTVA